MNTRLRGWPTALAVCVLLAGAAALTWAQDDKPEVSKENQRLVKILTDVTNEGVELYNSGDHAGCYRTFRALLLTVKPLLDGHKDLQDAIDRGLAGAAQLGRMDARAYALRTTLDEVRETLAGKRKPEDKKPEDKKPEDKKPEDKKPEDTKPTTLWDRLGKEEGVSKLVQQFMDKVGKDPKVDVTRGGKYQIKPEELKKQLVAWFSEKAGGPLKYTGKSMKEVHEGMGITNEQFTAAADDLKAVLTENKVAGPDMKTILEVVEATRKDIVEPKKPEDKKPEDKKPEDKKPEEKPGDTASVKGMVSYKGKPVTGGVITFVSGKTSVAGTIAPDGTYKVEKLMPGDYKVAVDTEALKLPPGGAGGTKPPAGTYIPLPAAYRDAEKSGLMFKVEKGTATYDILLR
jgi:hemoglobin